MLGSVLIVRQDFFDITFCYFPIAFRPPPNDPYGITADDLKVALRGCMSASPHFAKMALPLFLEKFATATGQGMVGVLCIFPTPLIGSSQLAERPIVDYGCMLPHLRTGCCARSRDRALGWDQNGGMWVLKCLDIAYLSADHVLFGYDN